MPKIDKVIEELAENVPSKKQRPMSTHYHIALIMKRGKVLTWATNKCKTRSKTPCSGGYTIHAERNAIRQLGDHSKLKGSTMLVVRVLSNGSFGQSKPCETCTPHLKKCMDLYGMKVLYSNGFSGI